MRDARSDASESHNDDRSRPLRARTGIFTDAAAGIGARAAAEFVRLGGDVVLGDPDELRLRRFAEGLARHGRRPHLLTGDVGDARFLERLYDRAYEEFGRVDHLLVNPTREDSLAALRAKGFHQQAWFEVNSAIAARCAWLHDLDVGADAARERSVTYLHSILPFGNDLQDYQRQRLALGAMIGELATQWLPLRVRVNAVVPSTAQQLSTGPASYASFLDAAGAAWAILAIMLDAGGLGSGIVVETVATGHRPAET